jgi:vancomycin resistance protein YoaR
MKITLAVAAAPLVAIAVVTAAWALDAWRLDDDQVARNVSLAGISVGGQPRDRLAESVEDLAAQLPETEVRIEDGDVVHASTAGELGIRVDAEATERKVMQIGRSDPLPARPVRWLRSLFSERSADVVVTVDAERLATTLEQLEGDRRTLPVEPSLTTGESGVELVPGTPGHAITVHDVVAGIPRSLGDISEAIVIPVEQTETPPKIADDAVAELATRANEITGGTVSLVAGSSTVEVEGARFRPAFALAVDQDEPRLTMRAEAVSELLSEVMTTSSNPTGVRFDIRGGVPVPVGGVDAQVCCADGAEQTIVQALLDGTTTIELPTRTVTAAEAREWAAGLGVRQVIGSFTTQHACCESRVTNIHRISDLTRGVLIPPGGTFSVNDTVGRRTREKGFVEGGVIQNGEFTTDTGGGVSQYATTLFNAAFFGGLDIPAYKAHSKYISRYPYGREATLAYPSVDLKIRNNTPHGVVIWPTYTDTSITVQLWGTPHAIGQQTAQNRSSGCGRVTTERTRTFVDGRVEKDTFNASYDCD